MLKTRSEKARLAVAVAGFAVGVFVLAVGACTDVGTQAASAGVVDAPAKASAFLEAQRCALCHSRVPTAMALTTATGDDASPHGLWRATAMANAFRDPYWRAQMAREVEQAPRSKVAIESLCLRCHAPMASHAARLAGEPALTIEAAVTDPLARDGVSCTVCHQTQLDGLGTPASFGGQLTIRDEKRIFGPYADPTPGPMHMHTGYTPTHGKHVTTSALCGACHTLYTQASADSTPFLEQAPYLEWRNSVFSDESGATADSRTCQQCHMPDLGTMKIARAPGGFDFNIAIRDHVRGHAFVGGNALLLDMLRENATELGVDAPATALQRMADATRAQLAHSTARIEVLGAHRTAKGLEFDVRVQNLCGHKLPSGYPSRRAWIEVTVREGREALFASGEVDARGHFAGVADELAIPHCDKIDSASQVAVYEMIAVDAHGQPTTSLAEMVARRKDTRLLPRGWRANGPHADETAPLGVEGDDDFSDGADTVSYSIDLGGKGAGQLTVLARLRYQTIPPAWADALRASRTPEAAQFVRMYDGGSHEPETLALTIAVIE
jgi:hypothetical protein